MMSTLMTHSVTPERTAAEALIIDRITAQGSITPLEQLKSMLAERADRDELVDIAYGMTDSPLGPLLIAVSPRGLIRIAFAREDFDAVLEQLARRSPRVLHAPALVREYEHQLEDYFDGRRFQFVLPIDASIWRGFRGEIQQQLRTIAYGHTVAYQDLARLAGRPGASRAVGTACATNPIPIVVPCHRVLRSDGSLGGYLGGVENKATLLKLESGFASRRERPEPLEQ